MTAGLQVTLRRYSMLLGAGLAQVLQLRDACRGKGLKVTGNKEILVARLRETPEAGDLCQKPVPSLVSYTGKAPCPAPRKRASNTARGPAPCAITFITCSLRSNALDVRRQEPAAAGAGFDSLCS